MYFKRLELFGFKSFADKTILNFEPGITAVVGPNGCGKSNIFDSIRWVLGEQSTKALRGSSMEDVIFNGTAQKPSLGFAEVSLTFANESRALPIDYDEVTITRRLFRSGESEYLLNKTAVRLKDIQELLMGTGIGAEAYSLIQQGKVDLVVSARPEDRRMIFDEASGITKYKSKKKEALNKLKDTENNLLRINDIITEVRRQIASSERQATKARKYKEEFKRLEALETQLALRQVDRFGEQRARLHTRIEELKAEENGVNAQLEESTALLTQEINSLSELEQKINDLHAQEIKLDGQLDLTNRQIGFNRERLESIEQNKLKLKEHKDQLIERCRVQQDKIERLKQESTVLRETLAFNEQHLGKKRDELGQFEASIREAKRRIQENEEKILTLTSQQVSVRNELTDIMKDIQGAVARKRRLEIEQEKVTHERQGLEEKLKEADEQIQNLRAKIDGLESERQRQGDLLDQLRAELAALNQRIDELEKKGLFYTSQKDFIERLHAQYNDIPDPLVEGRLITSTPPMEHHTGIIGKVKAVSAISNGAFGFLKSVFTKNGIQQLYEIVCEAKFIELDPQQISKKIEEIQQEITHLNGEKQERIARLEQEALVCRQIQQAIHDQEKALSVVRAQKRGLEEKQAALQEELDLIVLELKEVEGDLAGSRKKEEELNYRLDTVTQDIDESQTDIKHKQEWIAVKVQEKEEITVAIAQMETEIESQQDKIKSVLENFEMFTKDLDGWLEEIKKIDDEAGREEAREVRLAEEITTLTTAIDKIKEEKDALKSAALQEESRKQGLAETINEARAAITSLEEGLDAVKQSVHDQQMKEQELGFNEKGIKDRLQQTYKINLDERGVEGPAEVVSAESQVTVPDDWTDEQITEELERLRKRCDAFGSVNLVAIEEYEELKGRFEFLTKQQSDLLEAKSQLMSTISKINRSTRQMFLDTFEKVSEEFRTYFRMLFGGGEAQLILMDPENVLESGIEIIARPPGKKLQNISLLSGGEKTLTAIALIFGVFKVNPSPFCILDEIDAALDDSNVGRYSYLLKDFAKVAQFIVITHNKKTISSANIMYGITMPETGVSRVVSVKFADEKKQEEEVLAAV